MDETDSAPHGDVATSEPIVMTPVLTASSLSTAEKRKLKTLEDRIASGIQSFRDVGGALLEIRDSRLYRETHSSFEAYCDDKWDLERARAYQFMSAATVTKALPEGTSKMVMNEAQARALAPILREQGVPGVERILAGVQERGVPLTAPLIRRMASEAFHPNQVEPTVADRLTRDMTRLVTSYRQWLASGPGRKEKATVKAAAEQLIQALQ